MNSSNPRSRLMQYIRYQSRYGYEPFVLTLSALAVIATGIFMWVLFGSSAMP